MLKNARDPKVMLRNAMECHRMVQFFLTVEVFVIVTMEVTDSVSPFFNIKKESNIG